MPTYAIGDLQGCDASLGALLARIEETEGPRAKPDFIFVGDLVNRGPDSLAALRRIKAMGRRARTVLGNHDLNLLAVAEGLRQQKPGDTLDDILAAPDREELLTWLRHQPLAIRHGGTLVVHAGVLPAWDVAKALALAGEVEAVLRGPDWRDFLAHMYGGKPTRWDDSLRGHDRLRCIVNAFTRMRYCLADGSMDFSSSDTARSDGLAWFDVPGRAAANDDIVFGHWSALGLVMREHVMGIDTGCIWGGQLTALRLEDRLLVQVDCPQVRVPGED